MDGKVDRILNIKLKLMLGQDENHKTYLLCAWLDFLTSCGQKRFVPGQMFRSSIPSRLENEQRVKNMNTGTLEEAPHSFSGCIY
jgi:hypothetical protein